MPEVFFGQAATAVGRGRWQHMVLAEHVTVTARGRCANLLEPRAASFLWHGLRMRVPAAYGFVLMPDHVHLLAPVGSGAALRGVLLSYRRRFGIQFNDPDVQSVTTRRIAGRTLRYLFLNPVRGGLVQDPYSWVWTTLRDLVGVADPVWVSRASLAALLRVSPRRIPAALASTPDWSFEPPCPGPLHAASIDAVVNAVAMVQRRPAEAVISSSDGRRLVVQTLYSFGTPKAETLAGHLNVHRTSIFRQRTKPPHPALPAVHHVLSSPRLFRPWQPARNATG